METSTKIPKQPKESYQYSSSDQSVPARTIQPAQPVVMSQPKNGQSQNNSLNSPSDYSYNFGRNITNKSKTTAALLAFFLGSFGVHRFYLGQTGWGVTYIVLLFCWISPFLALIDGIRYLAMSNDTFAQKYGVN